MGSNLPLAVPMSQRLLVPKLVWSHSRNGAEETLASYIVLLRKVVVFYSALKKKSKVIGNEITCSLVGTGCIGHSAPTLSALERLWSPKDRKCLSNDGPKLGRTMGYMKCNLS